MTAPVIAIKYDRWAASREAPVSFRHPVRLWLKAVRYKANPRAPDYMSALLAERYPGARVIDAASISREPFDKVGKIVLLYPDAIGLGFSHVERELEHRAPQAVLEVLNGRRRQFSLDRSTKRALRLRRFLEWTMLVEWIATVVIVIVTPFLFAFDFVRGKS